MLANLVKNYLLQLAEIQHLSTVNVSLLSAIISYSLYVFKYKYMSWPSFASEVMSCNAR